MKERIVDLAVTYGLASRYTSFLVIEERTGARRATGQPETRVIPVNLPAGWAMFERYQLHTTMMNIAHLSNAPSQFASVFASRSGGLIERKQSKVESSPSLMKRLTGSVRRRLRREQIEVGEQLAATEMSTLDPTVELLNRQLASGLWDDKNGSGSPEIRQLRATVGVLVELLRANVTTTHRLYGRQIKKAVEAVIRLVPVVIVQEASLAEVALAAAWLAADSGRLRNDVEAVANHSPTLTTVAGCFSDEQTMREYIERSLPTL
jgi:Ca-activated chloride channel family protein